MRFLPPSSNLPTHTYTQHTHAVPTSTHLLSPPYGPTSRPHMTRQLLLVDQVLREARCRPVCLPLLPHIAHAGTGHRASMLKKLTEKKYD